jgi:hypothetical protein
MAQQTAIVLFNLGGPEDLSAVEPFLVNLFSDRYFLQALRNTAYFVVVTVIFQTTIPLLVANIANSGVRGSTAYRVIYFMPVIISLTVTGMLWSIIYEPNFGILNTTLRALGLGTLAQLWLANKVTVLPSLILDHAEELPVDLRPAHGAERLGGRVADQNRNPRVARGGLALDDLDLGAGDSLKASPQVLHRLAQPLPLHLRLIGGVVHRRERLVLGGHHRRRDVDRRLGLTILDQRDVGGCGAGEQSSAHGDANARDQNG